MNNLHDQLSNSITEIIIGNTYKNIRMYGYLLSLLQKEFVGNDHPVKTAGIGLINDKYKLFINENFWNDPVNMNGQKRVFLLCHEVLHTIYHHPLYDKSVNRALFNESTDLYINSVLLRDIGINCIPGCDSTKDWENIHKPALDTLIADYEDGFISTDEFNQKYSQIPIRGIHPDDYDDPDITIENCINKGSFWIYEKLFKYKEEQKKKNKSKGQSEVFLLTGSRSNSESDDEESNSSPSNNPQNESGEGESNNEKSQNNSHINPDDTEKEQSQNESLNTYINHDLPHPVNHDEWDDINNLSEGVKKFIQGQEEYLIKETLSELEKQQGNIPGYLKELLNKIINPGKPVFDYVGFIRKWASTFGNYSDITRSRSKPSLIIDDAQRLKFTYSKHLFVPIDTSGSMDNDDLNEVITELAKIQKVTKMKITLCEVDSTIHNLIPIESLNDINDYVTKRGVSGRGGTDFSPVTKHLKESKEKYSGVIYLTDGFLSKPKEYPKIPLLVVITSKGTKVKWDNIKVIQIPVEKFNKK